MDVSEHELCERLIRYQRAAKQGTVPAGATSLVVQLPQVRPGHLWHVQHVFVAAAGVTGAIARDSTGAAVVLELPSIGGYAQRITDPWLVLQPGERLEVEVTAPAGTAVTVRAWGKLTAPTPRPQLAPMPVLVAGVLPPPGEVPGEDDANRMSGTTTGNGAPVA